MLWIFFGVGGTYVDDVMLLWWTKVSCNHRLIATPPPWDWGFSFACCLPWKRPVYCLSRFCYHRNNHHNGSNRAIIIFIINMTNSESWKAVVRLRLASTPKQVHHRPPSLINLILTIISRICHQQQMMTITFRRAYHNIISNNNNNQNPHNHHPHLLLQHRLYAKADEVGFNNFPWLSHCGCLCLR